jgi:hypothetical protein
MPLVNLSPKKFAMTMLETHERAVETANAVYHEFLLYYKAREPIVYGFIEGKDDLSFYKGLVEGRLPENWTLKLIPAGNRNKVCQTYSDIDWSRFPKKRICFFIDKDLVEFLPDRTISETNVYMTDMYSIENHLTSFPTFIRVLEEILNVTGASEEELQTLQAAFQKSLSLFVDAMVPIMAQIILWRRGGKRPELDNIEVKAYFRFTRDKIV